MVDDVVTPATNHVAPSSEEAVETIVLHKVCVVKESVCVYVRTYVL